MIEHFSKWLELVSLLDCNSEGTAYTLLNIVFNRFGAPVEVFTDQGMEFRGDFQDLCEKALIDH
jgi:hypothetical protein